jgi:nucleoside-diphosphate-sugar epimerase
MIVALAGAGGDLGFRIAKALIAKGVDLRVLIRPAVSATERRKLEATGAKLVTADPANRGAVAAAVTGAACVVSALNGLRDVIVDRQGVLLDAAVAAGVPRFVPSDFAADFTKTRPGDNRNFDLRRDFMARADRAPIRVTSILNGAFMDMLGAEMPIIQPKLGRVLYWGSIDQPLDFTTKDDVAAFTARAVLDPDTPRFLRIAGDTLTPVELATAMTEAMGKRFKPLRVGGIGMLDMMIRLAKPFGPKDAVFPPYQGMQYLRDMMSGRGKLQPLDNARYPDLRWTRVADMMAAR